MTNTKFYDILKALLFIIIAGSFCCSKVLAQKDSTATQIWKAKLQAAKDQADWQTYADLYNSQTNLLRRDGTRFWEAYQLGREAVDSISFYLPDTSLDYGDAVANMAYFCRRLGQLQEAKAHYRHSIQIFQSVQRPDSQVLSALYVMLGTVDFMAGDWLEAKTHEEKSIDIWEEAGRPSYGHIPFCYLELGHTFIKLRNWAKSKALYKKCLSSSSPRYRIIASHGIALAYLGESKPDSAQIYLDYANAQQEATNPHYPHVAKEIQGKIFAFQQLDTLAFSAFADAQQLRVAIDPYRFKDLANGEKQIASQFLQMALFDSAFWHIDKGFNYIKLPEQLSVHSIVIDWFLFPQQALELYILKGQLFQTQYEEQKQEALCEQALASYEQAYELYHNLREDRVNEANKLLLSDLNHQLTEGALTTLYSLLQKQTSDKAALESQALLWMERYHGGILFAEHQKSEAFSEQYLPDSIRSQEKSLLSRMSFLKSQLQKSSNPDTLRQKQNELFKTREAYRVFRERIAKSWPQYGQPTKPITLETLTQRLKDLQKEADVCSFFWGKTHLFALTISPASSSPFSRQFEFSLKQLSNQASLAKKIHGFRTILETPDYSQAGIDSFCQYATTLYSLLSPALAGVSGKKSLFIQPDGALANLPFEILLAAEPAKAIRKNSVSTAYRNLPYWGREMQIAYFHSLNLMLTQPKVRAPKHSSLAVFAPRYAGNYHLKQNESITSELAPYLSTIDFSFEKATKASLLAEIADFEYSHVSVHGYPDEESPWDAYLQFAPHEESGERLYVHEIYNLDLPGSLVTLAACDVGKGRLAAGEGILSLARAFRYAGAATVVQSRWRADARVASALFPTFYQKLAAKESSLAAFSHAREHFLAEAPIGLTHPHFWANFAHWGMDKEAPASYWWVWIALTLLLLAGLGIFFAKK